MRRAMDHFTTDNELITKYVKELKLPTVKDCLEDTIAQALASGWESKPAWTYAVQRCKVL